MKFLKINLIPTALAILLSTAPLAVADTTTVLTFNQEFINWVDPHVATFAFPEGGPLYSQITLRMEIGCPGSPGDCDPWDRLGQLHVRVPTSDSTYQRYEIARFITPYDITGGGGPGTCSWEFDVTDYQTLLHDSVTLSVYITTWIGGNRGWLITAVFEMIEGAPDPEPYLVTNLWDVGYLVYGDPDNPPESHIEPVAMVADESTEMIRVRVTCTGHGQGNTHNAAEFSQKWHCVWIGAADFQHDLWRDDCEHNTCSPQGGTWRYDRAGWCPGDKVEPWDNSYLDFSPGETIDFYYEIEPYENFCRPTNPECVSGVTCTDCNYNSTGHTEPNYCLMVQAIFYRTPLSSNPRERAGVPAEIELLQNYPNPFNPQTTIRFTLPSPGITRLAVYNTSGQQVARLVQDYLSAGPYEVTFDGSHLTSGVYFYTLDFRGTNTTRKLLLLK
ncbi:T9SS type A sorting domain-containing protein [bacterium]|nr:T9SS type A sorting domain-containing protein [bacterium]MBU1982913.1 T9SS type A sorting domain-containing protein [bacterium]